MIFPWTCPFFGCSHMFPYLPIKSRWFPSVSSRRCWRQCHAGICLSPFIWRPGRIRLDLVKVQYVLWDHMRNMEIFGVFDGIMMDYLWIIYGIIWHTFWWFVYGTISGHLTTKEIWFDNPPAMGCHWWFHSSLYCNSIFFRTVNHQTAHRCPFPIGWLMNRGACLPL